MNELKTLLACLLTVALMPAASFDCAKATSKMDKQICSDPALSTADESMAAAYKKALAIAAQSGPDDAKAFKEDQRAWLEERGQPLLEAYKKRIDFLNYYAAHATGSAAPMTGTYEYIKTNFCVNCDPNHKSGVTQTGTLEIRQLTNSEARFSLEVGNTAHGGIASAEGRASINNGVLTYIANDGVTNCKLTFRFTRTAAIVQQGDTDCGFRMGTDTSGTYIKRSDSVSASSK